VSAARSTSVAASAADLWRQLCCSALGQFRDQYPGVHSVGDVGFISASALSMLNHTVSHADDLAKQSCSGRQVGPRGDRLRLLRETFLRSPVTFCDQNAEPGVSFDLQLFMIFLASSGILASSISFNAMSEHGTCTVVFAVVAAIIIGVGASARTFKQISWLGWAGICAIVPSILIVVIACGVSDRPPAAPPGPFDKQLKAFNNPSFTDGMVAVVNVCVYPCLPVDEYH